MKTLTIQIPNCGHCPRYNGEICTQTRIKIEDPLELHFDCPLPEINN